jgi:hypothetical protein
MIRIMTYERSTLVNLKSILGRTCIRQRSRSR